MTEFFIKFNNKNIVYNERRLELSLLWSINPAFYETGIP